MLFQIKKLSFVAILAAVITVSPNITNAATISGKAEVIDGDTVTINGTRIRLSGVDAPEVKQKCLDKNQQPYSCGIQAREALREIIGGNEVTCTGEKTERYGRQLMTCEVNSQDINASLVMAGWALAYTQYSRSYIEQERSAMSTAVGMWSGAFIAPWNWRRCGADSNLLGVIEVPVTLRVLLFPNRRCH